MSATETSRFLQRLRSGPAIVADGGMGALISSAVPRLRCPEEANLRAPESVVSVHVAYIRAGAELIETNTFGANRPKLSAHFLEEEFVAVNEAAVKLAREAREVSGREVFIAGAIGPLGDTELRGDDRSELYAEQATVLEGRGVDLFMVETFYDLDDLVLAIGAVRASSSLPVVALMTFDEDGETFAGVSAQAAAERLASLGSAAIGANHGAGPAAALTAVSEMSVDGIPLAALPNIGIASLAGSRIVYPHATPEYFAEFAAQAREPGRAPDRRLLRHDAGPDRGDPHGARAGARARRRVRPRRAPAPRRRAADPRGDGARATLRTGEWVVSVQLDPPLGGENARCSRSRACSRSPVSRTSWTSTTTLARARA